MEHLLDVKDLKVSFDTYTGEVQAVRGVDFYVDRGETLAIVGESGCGKSVTVNTVMKLNPSPPSRIKGGSVLYMGEELIDKTDKEMEKYRGREFSMVFQDSMTSLNPTMKVGKQLWEAIRRHENIPFQEGKRRVIEAFGKVGLSNPEKTFSRFPHTLSGGQRQRVMIAMAVVCNPSVLFADEPTTALDVTTQAQILNLLKELQGANNTGILLITHNLAVVARMAHRVAVMYAGKIVESGTVDDIFYRSKHPYTWGLIESMPDLIQDTGRKLMSISGSPPDLFSPPAGCAFAPRCPNCMRVCQKIEPEQTEVATGHTASCWLLDKRAGRHDRGESNA